MIAIIPARGGSKGLPGKNIKELLGKPMIAYTIEAALSSKKIDEVIVSTDCKEIENIALKYGAKSYFIRPSNLSTDTSMAIDTYLYTIDKLINEFYFDIKEFMVLLPTSPLRRTFDINESINIFFNNKASSVISYTEENHPLKWHKYIEDDGKFTDIFEDNIKNRQENRLSYFPNGSIYIFDINLIKKRKYYDENSYVYVMPRSRSIDVDTIDDFEYAEFLLSKIV